MNKTFRYSLFAGGGMIAVMIVLMVIGYISGIDKDVIKIIAAPKDATFLLDDSIRLKSGNHKLKTGTHTIKVSRQDFQDQIKEFTTVNGEDNIVWFDMIPSNESGEGYKETHQSEFQEVYDTANGQVIKATDDKVFNYPIIRYLPASTDALSATDNIDRLLPYDSEKYVINYSQSQKHPNDASKLALYITADSPAGRRDAIAYIYSAGFDPSDYEIIFETTTTSSINEGTGIGDIYTSGDDAENDYLYIDDTGDDGL